MIKKGAYAIIRPPRQKYNFADLESIQTIPNFGDIQCISIAFRNNRKQILYGTFYEAPHPISEASCVIYLHGNASNQLEGRDIVSLFVPLGIHVFAFDFSGCGESDGEFISLGPNETQDTEAVIDLLRKDFHIQKFCLWGRSMGASTSIFVLERHPEFIGAVIDSPYATLNLLLKEIASSMYIPNGIVDSVKKKVTELSTLDVNSVNPINSACNLASSISLFIIHGEDDTFINPSHSKEIFQRASVTNKVLRIVSGKHNSVRDSSVILEAAEFLSSLLMNEIVRFVRPTDQNTEKQQNIEMDSIEEEMRKNSFKKSDKPKKKSHKNANDENSKDKKHHKKHHKSLKPPKDETTRAHFSDANDLLNHI